MLPHVTSFLFGDMTGSELWSDIESVLFSQSSMRPEQPPLIVGMIMMLMSGGVIYACV